MSYLEELLPEFRKGAKIRQKRWKDGAYIEKCAQGIIHHYLEMCEVDILADDYEIYQEPIDFDYIIKNKCLCWFWNDKQNTGLFSRLHKVHTNTNYPFVMNDSDDIGFSFKHCRPVRREEVTFYEDRENA